MSNICLGLTAKKEKCNAKVRKPEHYCYRHKNQDNMISIKSTSKNYKPIVTKDFDDVCSICQCDVDKEEDCNLHCGHRHHIDCIKQVIKNECPICREPFVFGKKISIDIENIKDKEYSYKEEMRINQDATNELVIQLANEYQTAKNVDEAYQTAIENSLLEISSKITNIKNTDEAYQNTTNNSLLDVEEDIKKAIEESLLQQEIDQYELEAKIVHDSYWEREQQERERFNKLKMLPLDDWIHEIFENKPSIIIKLH